MNCFLRLKIWMFFIALCSTQIGVGQTPESTAPSPEEMLAYVSSTQDTTAMKYAQKLAEYYYYKGSIDSTMYYFKEGAKLAKINNREAFMTRMYARIIKMYGHFVLPGDVDSLKYYADLALDILEKKDTKRAKFQMCNIYASLGDKTLYHQENAEKAFFYYQKGLDAATEIEDAEQYLRTTYRVSNLYMLDAKLDEIIVQVENALEKIKGFNGVPASEYDVLLVKKMKAMAMGNKKPNAEEKKEIRQTFHAMLNWSVANKRTDEEMYAITDLMHFIFEDLGKDSILHYTNRAYEILQQSPNNQNKTQILFSHGKALSKAEQYAKAKVIFQETLAYHDENGGSFDVKSDLRYQLAKVNILLGNKDAALENLQLFDNAKDSLSVLKKQNSLDKIEAVYALEKSETENANLLLQNQLIQSRSNLLLIIGGLLLSLLAAGIYFFLKLRKNKQHLEKVNQSKNHLFAILAHDLKGPSASFNNLTKKISFLIRKKQPERLLELADYFEEAGNQINYVLSNLLDWALSQKDEISHSPERFSIKAEIDEAIKNLDYLAKEKNVQIENKVTPDTAILFDKNAFAIVMRNLLHNAVKYSHQDSRVLVEANPETRELLVRDAGVGMDKELINKIMQEIPVKSRTGTAKEKGNGIGMSTCVKLIRKNGGSIKIDSKVNDGTAFIVGYQ